MEFTVPLLIMINNKVELFYGEVVQEENIWKASCFKVQDSYFEHEDLYSCLLGLMEDIKDKCQIIQDEISLN